MTSLQNKLRIAGEREVNNVKVLKLIPSRSQPSASAVGSRFALGSISEIRWNSAVASATLPALASC